MSVHFISGKPGGGKSYYSLKLIVAELVHGRRVVITNLPINAGKLSEYLQERHPAVTVDLLTRLVLLTEEETCNFYRCRGDGIWCSVSKTDSKGRPAEIDYSRTETAPSGWKLTGVLYVIDEIHLFFNSRAWQETGKCVLFYLSQHRKLGDDVVCVTQHIGNVDKQFRTMTQDYTYLRNYGKEKWGFFRGPPRMVRSTFLEPATDLSKPVETALVSLEVGGLAECYDTAQGVGIHASGGADQSHKPRGISLWWGVGVVTVGLVCLAFIPKLMGSGAAALIRGAVKPGGPADVQLVQPSGLAGSPPSQSIQTPSAPVIGQPVPPAIPPAPARYVTSAYRYQNQWTLNLSDGTVIRPASRRIRLVGHDWWIIDDGERVELRQVQPE